MEKKQEETDKSLSDVSGPIVSEFADKKKLGFGFWLATFWLVLITFLAVFAPVLPFKDPNQNFITYEEKENPLTGKLQERPV